MGCSRSIQQQKRITRASKLQQTCQLGRRRPRRRWRRQPLETPGCCRAAPAGPRRLSTAPSPAAPAGTAPQPQLQPQRCQSSFWRLRHRAGPRDLINPATMRPDDTLQAGWALSKPSCRGSGAQAALRGVVRGTGLADKANAVAGSLLRGPGAWVAAVAAPTTPRPAAAAGGGWQCSSAQGSSFHSSPGTRRHSLHASGTSRAHAHHKPLSPELGTPTILRRRSCAPLTACAVQPRRIPARRAPVLHGPHQCKRRLRAALGSFRAGVAWHAPVHGATDAGPD